MNHPSQASLMSYTEGRMDLTLRCLVESHLHFCPACSEQVGYPAASDPAGSWEETPSGDGEILALAWGGLARSLQARTGILRDQASIPPELLRIVDGAAAPGSWTWNRLWFRKSRVALIQRDPAEGHALLCVHIRPGGNLPRHRHVSMEHCVVLRGGFRDESGLHGPGDWCESLPESSHRPVADRDGECWALVRLERRSGKAYPDWKLGPRTLQSMFFK